MKVCDFSRSFLTFVTPGRGNNARLQVESVPRLKDKTASKSQTYYFFASCKSEDTFAKENLFYEENYDFCGYFRKKSIFFFARCPRTPVVFENRAGGGPALRMLKGIS